MPVIGRSGLAALVADELAARPGRLRAALRMVAASTVCALAIMVFDIPHGGWAILTVFTVSQSDAGASLRRGGERLLGTVAGGLAALLAVMAVVDLPYFFVPLLGLATALGLYLAQVMTAPYPAMLGTMTYILVSLAHVEYPEDHVGVALWRIVAILFGVIVGTGAQVFLWPDDPVDKLRAGLARRLDLVPALVDRALAPAGAGAPPLTLASMALGDLTAELQQLANAEVLHPSLRARHAEHVALVLEVARLFTSALWAAETTPRTAERIGLDADLRARLLAIRDGSVNLGRFIAERRFLHAEAPAVARADAAAEDTAPAVPHAPVLEAMERSLDRIALLVGAEPPSGGPATVRAPVPVVAAPAGDVHRTLDLPAARLALKGALGLVFSYLVMLGLHWPGIMTATITCAIVAQTTVGATIAKAVLRQVGAVLGGLLGLIVTVVFMPNLTEPGAFLVVLAGGYLVAAWIAAGGPRTAYVGLQTALAFGIVLLGDFGPRTDLVAGRDRVLGILLGAAVMALIDQTIWPVQARLAMRPAAARALRLMAEVARAGRTEASGAARERQRGLRAAIYHALSQALALRDQARMEGDPDTPAARADSDLVLHVVTDAHALLPGLLAGAAERLAAVPSAGRGDLADHVEAFEDTIAALLDATADAVEGAPRPGFAALRVRAREMADAIDAEPWRARVPAAAEGDARLASRHVTSHQLLRLVVRLAPEV